MECCICKRRTMTHLNVSVRDYSGPGPHPVNGCFGVWKRVTLGYCNRHEAGARRKVNSMGHITP